MRPAGGTDAASVDLHAGCYQPCSQHHGATATASSSTNPRNQEMTHRDVRVVEVKTARPVTKSATADSHRSLCDIRSFSRAVAGEPLDLMFFPAVYSWFPVRRHLPMVVTLHDAIAEHLPGLIFTSWKGRLFVVAEDATRL